MLGRLARLIAGYSVSVREGDEVLIRANVVALPLVRELYREVLSRGGFPIAMLTDEVLEETLYRYAREETLKHVTKLEKAVVETTDVIISILSTTHTKHLNTVPPERISVYRGARRDLTQTFLRRAAEGKLRWTIAPYPTKALAQEAGMGLLDYEEFVYRACGLDREDPIAYWKGKSKEQEKIADTLGRGSELRFVGPELDLTVRVGGRKWINDDGHENMPGGEVFTGPIEDSVEGVIRFTYPVVWGGIEIEDIRLKFRGGVVVEAQAGKGESFLRKALETDEGAKRVGEVAFGLNYSIDRFTRNVLFDEKIGGTIHLALGSSYPETGGRNVSAIHMDIVRDMKNSRAYLDGDLIYENGRFLTEVL